MIQVRNGKMVSSSLPEAIVIREVNKFVYDVFSGTGWSQDSWSRVRRFHWGVKHIAGAPINKAQSKQLHDLTARIPFGWIEPVSV